MTIDNGKKVSLEYTLTHDGEQIESNVGKEPLTYIHGANQIIPGLEKNLAGMEKGQEKQVTVPPEEGYGPVQDDAIVEVQKDRVPAEAHVIGAQLMTKDPQGNVLRPTVKELKSDTVVLDFNHPLAGKTLVFDVKVVKVEESSAPAGN